MSDGRPGGPAASDGQESPGWPHRQPEWVYESLVRSVPGVKTSRRVALAVQFFGFEVLVLLLSWVHGLPQAAIAGTVGVLVSVVGSVFMLRLSAAVRDADAPAAYERVLFGSRIELVLGLVAFVLLIVYVFVYDPRQAGQSLVTSVLGDRPPILFSVVLLMVGWDVAYRIGVGWWASVVGLWRSYRFAEDCDERTRSSLARVDLATVGFSLVQLSLVPVLSGHPILQAAVVGHALAVILVSGSAAVLLARA